MIAFKGMPPEMMVSFGSPTVSRFSGGMPRFTPVASGSKLQRGEG